jgi:DNA polymerase family A
LIVDIVGLDFESYWSDDYTLRKLTPLEYVMDPRWETQSLSITHWDEETYTVLGERDIRHLLSQYNWGKHMVIGHNMSGFDAYVLAYRYGINPKLWGCTLAMARPKFGRTIGLSLKALCNHFGIGQKDNTILMQTKGRRLADFSLQERANMLEYNGDDSLYCVRLFKFLLPLINERELWHIDCLTRMRTEPMFELHTGMLEDALVAEKLRQRGALSELAAMLHIEGPDTTAAADQVRSVLASATRFSELLTLRGVDVPMKQSPTDPERMIPALAKSDREFIALQEHEDPIVASAAALRLDVKSTLTQTRIEAFLKAGALAGGRLPMPLAYCGAITTGRDSGEEYNPLNMPRIVKGKPKPSDALRNSLEAPAGMAIVVADFSGIELRVNHYLWQVRRTMQLYSQQADADLYIANAQEQYGRMDITKDERQVEKAKQLGLGFGAGAFTFKRVARTMGLELTDDQAQEYVTLWRANHIEIAGSGGGWSLCNSALSNMANGVENYYLDPWGLVTVTPEGFLLPSKRMIRYPHLRQLEDGKWDDGRPKHSWFYGQGRFARRIYGPKADENVVQALARDIMCDACIEIYKRTGYRCALRVYDELVYVVPDHLADGMLLTCHDVMREPMPWWPELVLWSEGDVAYEYGAAKG